MSLRKELSEKIGGLEQEIRNLESDVRSLVRQKSELKDEVGYSEQIIALKKRITDLELQEDKLTENHEREQREVEHMVGLERKRSEFEKDEARRSAILDVREEALAAQQSAFSEKMDFITKRFSDEVGYLKDNIVAALLERLPVVTVDRHIEEGNGSRRTPARSK